MKLFTLCTTRHSGRDYCTSQLQRQLRKGDSIGLHKYVMWWGNYQNDESVLNVKRKKIFNEQRGTMVITPTPTMALFGHLTNGTICLPLVYLNGIMTPFWSSISIRSSRRERLLPLVHPNQPTSWTTCWEACNQTSTDLESRLWLKASVVPARNPLLDR